MGSKNHDFKVFVREKGEQAVAFSKPDPVPCSGLNGEEAKLFYQETINSNPVTSEPALTKSTKRKKTNKFVCSIKSTNMFMLAQNNEVNGLKALIESGVDVNSRDEFGWTALMCATCNNAEAAVKYLLTKGADLEICDRGGYNAVALARRNKHEGILNLLLYRNSLTAPQRKKITVEEREIYCEQCDEKYRGSRKKHETSTVHLLKTNYKSRTFYGIPESNRGFQLLMQQGWDRERGLGPQGTGRKFPIKVKKKPDRCGVGATEKKKQVTEIEFSRPRKNLYRNSNSFERQFRQEFS